MKICVKDPKKKKPDNQNTSFKISYANLKKKTDQTLKFYFIILNFS